MIMYVESTPLFFILNISQLVNHRLLSNDKGGQVRLLSYASDRDDP